MEKNGELLSREIERELEGLKSLDSGSKEHTEAVEALCKLYRARLDQEKSDLEREKHEEEVKLSDRREANDEVYHERDLELKIAEKKDRRKKMIIDAVMGLGGLAGTVAGFVFYNRRFKDTLLFEKSDSISTIVGKNTINRMDKLLPKN